MRRRFVLAIAGAAALALGAAAPGNVVTYTSYEKWAEQVEALFGETITERNWEADALGSALTGLDFPEFTYAPPGGDDGSMIVEDLIAGDSTSLDGHTFTRGLGRTGTDDSLAIFGQFVAIGVFILESDLPWDPAESVDYYGEGDELLASQGFPRGPEVEPGNSTKIHFVGAIGHGDEVIHSIVLTEGEEPIGHRDNVAYGGVVFVTTHTPEPATIGLLALGAVPTLLHRLRRRK